MDTTASNWSTAPKLWLKEKTAYAQIPLNATQALYVNVEAIGKPGRYLLSFLYIY